MSNHESGITRREMFRIAVVTAVVTAGGVLRVIDVAQDLAELNSKGDPDPNEQTPILIKSGGLGSVAFVSVLYGAVTVLTGLASSSEHKSD